MEHTRAYRRGARGVDVEGGPHSGVRHPGVRDPDDADAARAWYRTRELPPPVVEAPARKALTPFLARPSSAPSTGLTLAELRARGPKGRP